MKSKTLYLCRGSIEDSGSPSTCNLDNTGPDTLITGYSPLPQFVANVDKEWPAVIWTAFNLRPGGPFDIYDAFSLFPRPTMILRVHLSSHFLKKNEVLFPCLMVWLFGSVSMLNELKKIPKGKDPV